MASTANEWVSGVLWKRHVATAIITYQTRKFVSVLAIILHYVSQKSFLLPSSKIGLVLYRRKCKQACAVFIIIISCKTAEGSDIVHSVSCPTIKNKSKSVGERCRYLFFNMLREQLQILQQRRNSYGFVLVISSRSLLLQRQEWRNKHWKQDPVIQSTLPLKHFKITVYPHTLVGAIKFEKSRKFGCALRTWETGYL